MRKLSLTKLYNFANAAYRKTGISDDYEVLHLLGKGSSARVFQGVQVMTGQKVVIKIFKKMKEEQIDKEIQINWQLLERLTPDVKHVKFIHLLDTLKDSSSGTRTLIYRFYPGVPLNQVITTSTLQKTLQIILTLAHTLKYVHWNGIVHRDMKPANILLTPSGPRLFDFGLAKWLIDDQSIVINNFGTKCYKCPQVILRMSQYDQRVDIWGLGFIMAELLLNTRHVLPFQTDQKMLSQISSFCHINPSDKKVIPSRLHSSIRIDRNKSWQNMATQKQINPQTIELVKRMISINPQNRPTLDQIINHPVFADVKLQP